MPPYKNCDHCGGPYTGRAKRFCGGACRDLRLAMERTKGKKPVHSASPPPAETTNVARKGDLAEVTVLGSKRLLTPQELIDRCDMDPDEWMVTEADSSQYEGFMKGPEGEPMVVPLHRCWARFRKKTVALFDLPAPVVIKITRPSVKKPSTGDLVSVHYSDIHYPHHDGRALNLFYQILDYLNPGITVDHGDTLDCSEISKWPKDPLTRVSLREEVEMGAQHMGFVHSITPNAEHIWLEGNHEERLKRLIWAASEKRDVGELLSLPKVQEVLTWESLLGLDSLGWECIPYPHHRVLFDRLILAHGDATGPNVAQKLLKKFGKSGISGHTHKRSAYETRDYNGHHAWFEIGMLGRIRDDYKFFPDWAQGFGVTTWSKDRKEFGFEQIRIHEGVAYFRGKRFVGDSKMFSEIAA